MKTYSHTISIKGTRKATKEEEDMLMHMQSTLGNLLEEHLQKIYMNSFLHGTGFLPPDVRCTMCSTERARLDRPPHCDYCQDTSREPVPFSEVWGS